MKFFSISLFQPPSAEDFFYVGMVAIFILLAYRISKLKSNLGLFGSCGLVCFPVYGIAGYLFFLLFKSLGIIPALIGTACLMLFVPFFIMSFSLFFERGLKKKCFTLPKDLIQPSLYSLLFLGAIFIFFYLFFLSITHQNSI